jgi:DNA-directed RNA polymerase specialized sigma24 family protein
VATDKRESPIDDAHLPRRQRRFPFIALNHVERDEVRAEIDAVLLGIENMIHKLILRNMFRRERQHRYLRDDIAQDVRVHLYRSSLAHFDQTRGVKLTTFLYSCVANSVKDHLKRHRRKRRRTIAMGFSEFEIAAPDTLDDRAIERFAEAAMTQPEKFGLSRAESGAVRAISKSRQPRLHKDIAAELKYSKASSLSLLLTKAANKLIEADIYADLPSR